MSVGAVTVVNQASLRKTWRRACDDNCILPSFSPAMFTFPRLEPAFMASGHRKSLRLANRDQVVESVSEFQAGFVLFN